MEIKYRAYDKVAKRMFSYQELKNATGGMVQAANEKLRKLGLPECPNGLFLPTDDPNMIFMQDTGLQDKNGIEIYESDIVHYKNNYYENLNAMVTNKEARFGIWDKCNDCFDFNCLCMYLGQLEVIGNIFDNPELLKEK